MCSIHTVCYNIEKVLYSTVEKVLPFSVPLPTQPAVFLSFLNALFFSYSGGCSVTGDGMGQKVISVGEEGRTENWPKGDLLLMGLA